MKLTERLRRSLQNAVRISRPAAPVVGVARVPANIAPAARQVDAPTVPLPPVNSRYQSRRPQVEAVNRNNLGVARRGSARTAVGL